MTKLIWLSILLAFFSNCVVAENTSDFLNLLSSELSDFKFEKFYNSSGLNESSFSDHPHAHMNVVQLVEYYNYAVENHTVVTRDGYYIELHRITGNHSKSSPNGKPAVLLQHGILCSSMDWLILGPSKSLGFLLADAGYDVWIGNNRGNRYCRNHVSKSVKSADFWDFSWHEIGKNDLPSLIDYIIEVTENEKIYYIGHSQGATTFFVLLSENPEYNDKIKAMVALAPVAYASHIKSPLFQLLSKHASNIHIIMQLIGQNEFKPGGEFFKWLTSKVCDEKIPSRLICTNILFLISGYDQDQLDLELLPAILAHTPAGSSVKQFVHYAQLMNSGHFRQYDYGLVKNWIKYRSIKLPSYNLKNVKVPVSVHYGMNDWLTGYEDIKKLYSQLPNPIGKFRVPYDKFNHVDFVWAKDVKTLVNDKIISLISRY